MFILDHQTFWGSPLDNETWLDLDGLLRSRWPHPNGGELKVDAAAIDAGDGGHYDAVLKFCAARRSRKRFAIKGAAGFARPAIVRAKTKGKPLFIVGVDNLKTQLVSRLARGRSIRFSDTLEPRFYEEITSEKRIVRMVRGKPTVRFERIPGRRAECLDAVIYAMASRAALVINLDLREAELRVSKTPALPPPPPVVPERREPWVSRRPGWLGKGSLRW